LLEHVAGTAACARFGLRRAKLGATGDMAGALRELGAGGPPQNRLGVALPAWLADPAEYRRACEEELAAYERIAALAAGMSDAREATKARLLVGLLDTHRVVLAFDRALITLDALQQRLGALGVDETVAVVATGEHARGRRRVRERTRLGRRDGRLIALCSDSMAEGFNLTEASAVVHLDMPSVIRLAEQRVGRADRMDSPHARIDSFWPDDGPEFAVRADEAFYARHRLVADLLGSNVPLPDEPAERPPRDDARSAAVVATADFIRRFEAEREPAAWDGIGDAFALVRDLVEGPRRLVPEPVYAQVRRSEARVVSSVSAVVARHAWAFFAVAGTEWGAPRWVYLDGPEADPVTDLRRSAEHLRAALTGQPAREFDEAAAALLSRFLERLQQTEVRLLPRRKQRALEEGRWVLGQYLRAAVEAGDHDRAEVVRALLGLLSGGAEGTIVDLSRLAECWLDLVRPAWYERLSGPRSRGQVVSLRLLRKDLLARPVPTDELRAALDRDLTIAPVDRRVVAAIVGVPPAQA
jgi:hypothetical protein